MRASSVPAVASRPACSVNAWLPVPLTAIHHGPLPRAAQTAGLISQHLPGVPLHCSEAVGDYVPPVPDVHGLPEVFARFLDGVTANEYAAGAALAATAIERHAGPGPTDTHELIVTHSFLIAWFVHALDAPPPAGSG